MRTELALETKESVANKKPNIRKIVSFGTNERELL